MYFVCFVALPVLIFLATIALSVASAVRQPSPLQWGVAMLVLLLIAISVLQWKQIAFNRAYPTYLPVITTFVGLALACLQHLTARRSN